jgi:hypothetical protein
MNLFHLQKRAGEKLKFRNVVLPNVRFRCECCETRTTRQVATARGRSGRRTVIVAWTWICPEHEKALKNFRGTEHHREPDAQPAALRAAGRKGE